MLQRIKDIIDEANKNGDANEPIQIQCDVKDLTIELFLGWGWPKKRKLRVLAHMKSTRQITLTDNCDVLTLITGPAHGEKSDSEEE